MPRPQLLCAIAGLVLVSFAIGAAGDEVEKARVKAIAETRTLVRTHAHWDANCHALEVPRIDITKQPAHGTVDVAEGDFPVRRKRLGNSPCIGITVHGAGLYYTPAVGYRGADVLAYDVRSSGLPALHFEVEMSVE
jgi:hypothetical protein